MSEELPGDVFQDFKKVFGFRYRGGQADLARKLNSSPSVVSRWNRIRAGTDPSTWQPPFTDLHLDFFDAAGFFKRGTHWWHRFESAMERQNSILAEAHSDGSHAGRSRPA